jgi:hypothetical protein
MFGFPTDGALLGSRFRKKGSEYFQGLVALLIDEVSMVRVDVMDNIDRALKHHRNSTEPFGGLKVIMFGDPFQLPPVLRYEDTHPKNDPHGHKWRKAFIERYFFLAPTLIATGLRVLELTHIHRQGEDHKFAEVLNRIRVDRASAEDISYINRGSRQTDFGDQTLRVYGKNDAVDAYNKMMFSKIHSPEFTFRANWFPNKDLDGSPLRGYGTLPEAPTDHLLSLKHGARVIFIKNDDQMTDGNRRWVNGSAGQIWKVGRGEVLVELDSGQIVPVGRSRFEIRELVSGSDSRGRPVIYGDITGWFEQIPIKLGWAVSVHKSQGQTLDSVVLEFGEQYFEAGQAYVALSRARALKHVHLVSPLSDVRRALEVAHVHAATFDLVGD